MTNKNTRDGVSWAVEVLCHRECDWVPEAMYMSRTEARRAMADCPKKPAGFKFRVRRWKRV